MARQPVKGVPSLGWGECDGGEDQVMTSSTQPLPEFGICMAGLEEEFVKALREKALPGKVFNYVEIGVAYGQTMRAVAEVLRETSADWRVIGIDPSPIAWEHYQTSFTDVGRMRLWNDTREVVFKHIWPDLTRQIHFAFIDGCHSKSCVMGDFLDVERFAVPGALVVFHDFGEESVGTSFQPHCGMQANVRGAVKELRLFDDSRPGWKRLPDWIGDKARQGADCGVFERVE